MAQGKNNTKTAKKTKEVSDCFFQLLYFQEEISLQLLSYEDFIYPHRVCDFPSHLIFVQFKNMGKWRRPSHF